MDKKYISADDLLLDSFRLAVMIFESGFVPDFLVGLWRGGSAVGIAVQEGLDYLGIETDHISIRTSYAGRHSYSEVRDAANIRVHGLQYLLENLNADNSLLIVDDVYSTGSSVNALIKQLEHRLRLNMPEQIRTAAVWYRASKKTIRVPDYHVRETQDWLVLPYELSGLTVEEICERKPGLASIMEELRPFHDRIESDSPPT